MTAPARAGVAESPEKIRPARVFAHSGSDLGLVLLLALGACCVLFSGGHHSRDHLQTLDAPVVDDLTQVAAHVR